MADNFNFRDFGIGLATGWGTAFILYQLREVIGRARSDVSQRVQTAQRFAAVSAEGRYIAELVREAERSHLAGDRVALSKVAVEPRFIPAPPFAEPPDDDLDTNVFRVVPKIHDLPWLHQPFNVPTVSIDDLGRAGGVYALLGMPGSGRTTALNLIAMHALGAVDFTPPPDAVTTLIAEADAQLNTKERTEREKLRMSFEQRAYERIREMNEQAVSDFGEAREQVMSPYRRLLPVYVHLSDVKPTRLGKTLDPAEPLVRALQQQIHPRTAKLLPRRLYPRLENGGVLVLLDGFDAQSPARQSELASWLTAFLDSYAGNSIIVAGDVRGSGLLIQTGLTPVYLRPWSDSDTQTAARKWTEAWPEISSPRRGRAGGQTLPPDQLKEAIADARGLHPSEITLKLWAGGRGVTGRTPGTWAEEYVKALGLEGDLLQTAIRAAVLQQDEAIITPARLTEIVMKLPSGSVPIDDEAAPEPPVPATAQGDDLDDLFGAPVESKDDLDTLFGDEESANPAQPVNAADLAAQLRGGGTAPKPAPKSEPVSAPAVPVKASPVAPLSTDDARAAQKLNRQHGAQLLDLFKRGLLIEAAEGYQFRHSILRHYLAAVSLRNAPDADIVRRSLQLTWEESMAYTAGLREVGAAVTVRLESPPDVRYSNLTTLARWGSFIEAKPKWRAELLRQLGSLMLSPTQYPALRERFAAAIVGMRDTEARKIFDRGIGSPDADTRRVSALGAGVLRDEDSIPKLTKALRDVVLEVQLAAAAGLGVIGTDAGDDGLAVALLEGSELVRQMAAETLADRPEVGFETLYRAVSEDDVDLRRAAVFGLGRVRTRWSALEVYRVFLDDSNWYVRSAAQTMITEQQTGAAALTVRRYPTAENINWLRDWVANFGARMSETDPEEALVEMLFSHDPAMQPVAAQAVGQLGLTQRVASLYGALKEPEPAVRDAAHRALAHFELLTGQALPAPV